MSICLGRVVSHGARAVKWIPSAMGIDPASPACDRFFEALTRLDVPLLIHGGYEHPLIGSGTLQEFNNPLTLRADRARAEHRTEQSDSGVMRKIRGLISIVAILGVALGIAWFALADRSPVHEYHGDTPPSSGLLAAAKPPHLALVLGGGGPRGFAHIGVLKVLEQEGIVPDLIVGSSMGSLIAALYGADPNAARLEARALQMNPRLYWRDLTLVRSPYLKGDLIENLVREAVGAKSLAALTIPVVAVVTDVRTGAPVAFTDGDAPAAVRASTAIPGTFKRVRIASREYFDGDISGPVPVRTARSLGARVVIAVDVMSRPNDMPEEMRDYPDLMLSDFYRYAINLRDLEQADVVIAPRLGYYSGWSREKHLHDIAAAESATHAALPEIRKALRAGDAAVAATR